GAGSSFSPKYALTPLSPFAPPSLPLRKRRLPLPSGSHPANGRPPVRLVAGLATGTVLQAVTALRAGRSRPCPRAAAAPVGGASARRRSTLRAPLASLSGWPWS
ncbi:hypothetical protein BHE74_00058156, partial [Ensete ventricosum]